MSALLLIAYHDLVRYAIPLALLSNVAYIFGEIKYTVTPQFSVECGVQHVYTFVVYFSPCVVSVTGVRASCSFFFLSKV